MWQSRLVKNVIACIAISSAAVFGTASPAHAATCDSASLGDPVISGSCIWDKTDVENFTTIAFEGDWSGSLLGIFDGNTVGSTYLPVNLNSGADTITYSQAASDWLITNQTGQSLNIGATTEVIFGVSRDNGATWSSETQSEFLTSSAYKLTFANSVPVLTSSSPLVLLETDLAPAGTFDGELPPNSQPVPVPAAIWLFGSGLLGLIGIGRQRKAT
jgi:hypothetical protein